MTETFPDGSAPTEWQHQKILNIEWPPSGIVKFLPDRRPVPVDVRVEWEHDGEEWLPGRAVRWTRPVVFVLINDRRHHGAGLWVPTRDVRRA